MNKKQFLEALTDTYTRIGRVKHGVGVVAIRTIPKGTDPFKRCDIKGSVLKITEEEFESYKAPEAAKELVRDFCALQGGIYYVPDYGIECIDKSYFLNHSRTPNVTTLDEGESFRTMRRIKAGEELTSNYDLYDETKQFKR